MARPLTLVDQQLATAALDHVWSSIDDLVAGLDDDEWRRPTALPGWDIQATVAHIIGTESMLLGLDPAHEPLEQPWPDHVRNDIGAFNERWVAGLAASAPAEMLERYRSVTDQRRRALEAVDADTWDAETWTPAGPDSYGRFMRIRVFDCWLHDQDIRDALGTVGHTSGPAVDLALQEMAVAMPYVVGKKAGAPTGSAVTLRLTGDEGRDLHIAVGERATLVDALDDEATTTVTMPVGTFVRLAGGRQSVDEARPSIEVTGDTELGHGVVDNLNYTI